MKNQDPAAAYAEVSADIGRAARDFGRDLADIRLVCVSKTIAPPAIARVLEAGHRTFGENRVQEAQDKWPALKERFPDVELHLIGPLQSNKAGDAVALFDVIQTLDRVKLARALAEDMARQNKIPALFVQVNIGGEPQKSGVAIAECDAFVAACRRDYGLKIEGLMCVPPVDALAAPYFALLARLAARNGLEALSMGMSGDYRQAIQLGARYVRIGSAIFGDRAPPPELIAQTDEPTR